MLEGSHGTGKRLRVPWHCRVGRVGWQWNSQGSFAITSKSFADSCQMSFPQGSILLQPQKLLMVLGLVFKGITDPRERTGAAGGEVVVVPGTALVPVSSGEV